MRSQTLVGMQEQSRCPPQAAGISAQWGGGFSQGGGTQPGFPVVEQISPTMRIHLSGHTPPSPGGTHCEGPMPQYSYMQSWPAPHLCSPQVGPLTASPSPSLSVATSAVRSPAAASVIPGHVHKPRSQTEKDVQP